MATPTTTCGTTSLQIIFTHTQQLLEGLPQACGGKLDGGRNDLLPQRLPVDPGQHGRSEQPWQCDGIAQCNPSGRVCGQSIYPKLQHPDLALRNDCGFCTRSQPDRI